MAGLSGLLVAFAAPETHLIRAARFAKLSLHH